MVLLISFIRRRFGRHAELLRPQHLSLTPIAIGPYGEEFIDGALGSNNPVYALWSQAQDLWGSKALQENIGCLISIGTGKPALAPFPEDILDVGRSLIALATETESTAE